MDQYLTKPFALPELLSRVRNLLDRRRRTLEQRVSVRPSEDVIRFGDVSVDFSRFELRRGSEVFPLTTREQELLRYFLEMTALSFRVLDCSQKSGRTAEKSPVVRLIIS